MPEGNGGPRRTTPVASGDMAIRDVGKRTSRMTDSRAARVPASAETTAGIATGLIISVPLVMRMPWLRRTPIGKLIELGGGAALVVKFAEMIRDWEREQEAMAPPQVIDVPPVGSV